jgi:REP element-mobilizing transposase RayT
VAHAPRSDVSARYPQHVTLRVVEGVRLRREWLMPIIHGAIADSQKSGFRIVEFNVLDNHIHQIVEVDDAKELAAGMTGFQVRMQQRLNRKLRRTGSLFDGRFHSRALSTPTEVRNALRYVLLNARHHAAEQGRTLARGWVDTYSSAPWFDSWDRAISRPVAADPTATASSWLLSTGWRRLGLLSINDVPGDVGATRVGRALPAPAPPRYVRAHRPPSGIPQLDLFTRAG